MGRKHFQSHWNEMAEMKRARPQPPPKEAKKKDGEVTPTSKSSGEDSDEEGHLAESLGRARRLLHRFRHAAIAASVTFISFSMMGVFREPGRADLDLVRVSGQVLVDGKPLKFGIINFVPRDGRGSTGILDAEGRFTLTCLDGSDGAVCGIHDIEILPDGPPDELGVDWPLDKSFANYSTSGESREITGSADDLKIELVTSRVRSDESGDGDPNVLPSE